MARRMGYEPSSKQSRNAERIFCGSRTRCLLFTQKKAKKNGCSTQCFWRCQGEMEETRTIWQISAGPASRNYEDILFQYGVALIGPSGRGAWTLDRLDTDYGGGYIRQIANEVKAGDVVLLRHG